MLMNKIRTSNKTIANGMDMAHDLYGEAINPMPDTILALV